MNAIRVEAPQETILNALIARDVLKWKVLVRTVPGAPPEFVGTLPPPPYDSGMLPIPPFGKNVKSAFIVLQKIDSMPEPVRRKFSEELKRIICEDSGIESLNDWELVLKATPRQICLSALHAVR